MKIIIVNRDLPEDKLNRMGFESARTVQGAIEMAKGWHREADVAVMPAGAETMARLTP